MHSSPYKSRSYDPDATTKRFGASGVEATASGAGCFAALPCAFFDFGGAAVEDGAEGRGGLLKRAFLAGAGLGASAAGAGAVWAAFRLAMVDTSL